jgi:hypothetical protein
MGEKRILDKRLQLSTIEFYAGSILAIIVLVYSMTWWLKVLLIIALSGIIIDLIARSPFTIKWHWIIKTSLSLSTILWLIVSSWNPVKEQWIKDHPTKQNEQKPSVAPPEQSKQLTAEEIAGELAKKLIEQTFKPTPKKETPPTTQPEPQPPIEPLSDVALRFVHSKEPAVIIKNLTDSVAHNILWSVVLWNIVIFQIATTRFLFRVKHMIG